MISTLELKQFRGLEHVKFENLGRANLIIGGNNTGKTSILEALVMLCGSSDQAQNLPTTFREQPVHSGGSGFWEYLLPSNDPKNFSVAGGGIKVYVTRSPDGVLNFKRTNPGSSDHYMFNLEAKRASFHNYIPNLKLSVLATKQGDPSAISELYNQIAPLNPENETKLEDLIRKSIDPRLRRLRYARPQGTKIHLVYVDFGGGPMLPMTQLGQAFSRTLQVYCEIFANCPKILLIDEIENGLYYEGMEDFWKGLMAVLEDQDVQLFATTHSRECMEAAQKAASAMEGDPLRFLRLDRRVDDPGKIVATTFGKEEMQTAIEFNREMR
jgi:hypothetical protein